MRSLVRERQHVAQALARVRHFLLGQVRNAGIQPEAIERITQVGGEVTELRHQIGVVVGGRLAEHGIVHAR